MRNTPRTVFFSFSYKAGAMNFQTSKQTNGKATIKPSENATFRCTKNCVEMSRFTSDISTSIPSNL